MHGGVKEHSLLKNNDLKAISCCYGVKYTSVSRRDKAGEMDSAETREAVFPIRRQTIYPLGNGKPPKGVDGRGT